MTRSFPSAFRRVALIALFSLGPAPAYARVPDPGMCAPPRTLVALLPLADRTDRTWQAWTGENPALRVVQCFADSLENGLGRAVCRVSTATGMAPQAFLSRPIDDAAALRAALTAKAEIAVTGTVSVFTHDDHREAGRFGRWGVGALDARSRVQVSVTLRVLDVADGSVIIETTASREKTTRGTASASRAQPIANGTVSDELLEQVLSEVLGDLSRTIGQRLDARWRARVILEGSGIYVLDAGAARGLFPGERLDVWRSGVEVYDENLLHVGDDARVGALVIVALEGHGRARARLAEGEARMGDTVRPCSEDAGPAMSVRR